MPKSAPGKMALKSSQDGSPVPFALKLLANGHLTNPGFRR